MSDSLLPRVSVIVPCFNNAATIGEALEALEAQTYAGPWEIIVIDNASHDETASVVEGWRDRLPQISMTTCLDQGKAFASNHGVSIATGSLLAFCDADDRVAQGWLASAVEALGEAELATGPVDLALLSPTETYAWRGITGWQRVPDSRKFLPAALGCNLAVRRETFEELGGFSTQAGFADDLDLVWRAQLAGASLGFAEGMLVHWRSQSSPWSYFTRHVAYAVATVTTFANFAQHGMPRQLGKGVVRLVLLVPSAPLLLLRSQRYRWLAVAGTACGHVVGSIKHKVLYL